MLDLSRFPPPSTGYEIGGELINVDHVNRSGKLRPDRSDSQPQPFFDLPLSFELLPYGTIHYHGSPATLADVPLGTHLRGQFHLGQEGDVPAPDRARGKAYDSKYSRVLLFEDDSSYHQRQGQSWTVKAIDPQHFKLTCDGPEGEAVFDYDGSTRVWKQQGFGALADLSVGQSVQVNLTRVGQFGPGHILDIWLDQQSLQLAAERQAQRYLHHQRRRGVACGVLDDLEFDDGNGRVTVAVTQGPITACWISSSGMVSYMRQHSMIACEAMTKQTTSKVSLLKN